MGLGNIKMNYVLPEGGAADPVAVARERATEALRRQRPDLN